MAQQRRQPPTISQQGIGGQRMGGEQMGARQVGGRQAGGQQAGGQQIPTMPGVEPTQQLPSELRTFLDDLSGCVDVLEWEKTLAIQSGRQAAPVVAMADDVAEIGKLTKELVARDSMLAPQAVQLFTQASEQALGTFQQQRGQVPGVERVTSRLRQTLESAGRVQQRLGGQQQPQQSPGQQSIGGQPGQQAQQPVGQQGRTF
jgi:hypothetical protein